jgi:hypothetical protein
MDLIFEKIFFGKYSKSTIAVLLLYVFLSLLLFQFLKYVIAQDEIPYITIALKYQNGNFKEAVNGIWSPLISWMLVPFLVFKINPLFAFKILQIIIGGLTLFFASKLLNIFTNNVLSRIICLSALSIIIIYFVYFTATPDLLLALFSMVYIYILLKNNFSFGVSQAIIIGIIGALIYFSKAYGFPFFIMHFTIISFIIFFRSKERRKEILRYYLITMLVFGILCSAWVVALSNKYGNINYTLSGKYNYNFAGPKYKGIQSSRIEHLYPPANDSAVSYWEDPSFLIPADWSPFASWDNFKYQLTLIVTNTKQIIYYLAPFIILSSLLFIFFRNKKEIIKNKKVLFLGFTFFVYIGGLLLIMIQERFLVLPLILIVIFLSFLLSKCLEIFEKIRPTHIILVSFILLFMVAKPFYSIIKNINMGKSVYKLSYKIKNDLNLNGNIASMTDVPLAEDWAYTTDIAFINNLKYYGELNRHMSKAQLTEELKKYNIDYFFVWDGVKEFVQPQFSELADYKIDASPMINNGLLKNLAVKIFKIFRMQKEKIRYNEDVSIFKVNVQ